MYALLKMNKIVLIDYIISNITLHISSAYLEIFSREGSGPIDKVLTTFLLYYTEIVQLLLGCLSPYQHYQGAFIHVYTTRNQ